MKNVIIGTAGHIDHGKSSLVKALTGTDPDRLREEKERGITIDIGFASLKPSPELQIGFVDVPGHERFIKNMLAGVGGIDAVLLAIAGDESIMPQTREHFDICKLLRVQSGVIAITKSDLVDSEMIELVRAEVRGYLRDSFLENAPVVPVSSATGLGLDELRAALQSVAESVPSKSTESVFRLPIDRCFTLHGFGTVVTGTIVSGTIQKDDEVQIYPTGKKARIRNLQVYGGVVGKAFAGQRAALNLLNIEVNEIQRGMQLSVPDRFSPVFSFDAQVHLLKHSPISLRKHTRVRVHHGTSEMLGFVSPIGSKEVLPGQTCFGHVVLRDPVLAIPGDLFILRRTSPMVTIGGGTILSTLSRRTFGRDVAKTIEHLRVLESGSLKESIMGLARRSSFAGTEEGQIISQTLAQKATVRAILTDLANSERLRILSESPYQAMDMSSFIELAERALEAVKEFHAKEPLSAGIPKGQLHSASLRGISQSALRAIIDYLQREGLILVNEDRVKIGGHELVLNEQESLAKQQIERVFLTAGWKVPTLDEVLATVPVPRDQARQLVTILTKEKRLIKISDTLFFHAASLSQLRNRLAEYRKESEKIDVGAFKNLTSISRKYAIPLLEYLDRERITKRVGDSRIILVK
jgi:selenocysteine-specific elongation factor